MTYHILDKDGRLLGVVNMITPLHVGSRPQDVRRKRPFGTVFKIAPRDAITGEIAAYVR